MKRKSENPRFTYTLSDDILMLQGTFILDNVDEALPRLIKELNGFSGASLTIRLEDLTQIDSAGVLALHHIKDVLADKSVDVKTEGGSDKIQKNQALFAADADPDAVSLRQPRIFERIGGWAYEWFSRILPDFIYFAADLFFWTVIDLFRRKQHRKGEVVNQAVLIGVNAVPVVSIMTFLIGAVLALQSAYQLRSFGANVFIVDLTVIAMMREMGPLITAILVAGRSGSAIASEVATMKITEELDALKTMGLNPVRFVMVPKMQAGVWTIPFLTIIADVMGIAGGMLIAYLLLDITPVVFFNRMGESLFNRDIITGIIKSIVFVVIIVLIGCYSGSRAERGATDVGRVTTAAVVVSISLVILADSVLGLLFY